MDRGVFFALLAFTVVLLVLWFMATLLSPFLPALAWAGVIALAFYPLHRVFLRWTGGRKLPAAGLTTALVVLIVLGPVLLMGGLIANETLVVVDAIQKAAHEGKIPGWEQIMNHPLLRKAQALVEPYARGIDVKAALLPGLKSFSGTALSLSGTLFKNLFGFMVSLMIMGIALFFAFRDGEEMAAQFWSVIPLKPEEKAVIRDTLKRVISAVLYGIILTCVVQGILGGIGLALAGIPSAIFFGALMTLCAFIPMIGTVLVWGPAVIYLFATGRPGSAIFLLCWSVLVVSSIDNLIRPIFISGHSKIPILVIALGVLGGLATFGFLGLVLGPLIFAISLELFKIYRQFYQRNRAEASPAPKAESPPGGAA